MEQVEEHVGGDGLFSTRQKPSSMVVPSSGLVVSGLWQWEGGAGGGGTTDRSRLRLPCGGARGGKACSTGT